MTHLFIEPGDVLVFRDGRPFDAGSDHLATGPFPPLPPTLYGALRSALLAQHDADFHADDFGLADATAKAALGTKPSRDDSGLGTLALTSVALARRIDGGAVERLYPAPFDLLTSKTKEEEAQGDPVHVLLRPMDAPKGVKTNLPEGLRPLWPAVRHHATTFYENTATLLTEAGLAHVLGGEPPEPGHLVASDDVYLKEPRTQVSLRGETGKTFSGTAQEGKLFTVEFARMAEHAGLAVSVEADGLLDTAGLLRLGAESRAACFEAVSLSDPDTTDLRPVAAETGRVRAVLTTPAPFQHGWRPDGIEGGLQGRLGGVAVHLVACAVGRPVNLGGWDLAARPQRPKRARPAAPAGSVYFLQLDRPFDASALFDALDGRSLCTGDDARQGLGLVRLGIW